MLILKLTEVNGFYFNKLVVIFSKNYLTLIIILTIIKFCEQIFLFLETIEKYVSKILFKSHLLLIIILIKHKYTFYIIYQRCLKSLDMIKYLENN